MVFKDVLQSRLPEKGDDAEGEKEMTRMLPILFKGEMVRAIREGHKTQTRRVIKPHCEVENIYGVGDVWLQADKKGVVHHYLLKDFLARCPYQPGDRLWVRETWRTFERGPAGEDGILYRADNEFRPIQNTKKAASDWVQAHRKDGDDRWRPSIFMPRWASRLTLVVTEVRVEKVQSISEEDARAEGCDVGCRKVGCDCAWRKFGDLWSSINAKRGFGWATNPWVYAVTFKVDK